jgi:hypothetical protein
MKAPEGIICVGPTEGAGEGAQATFFLINDLAAALRNEEIPRRRRRAKA